MFAVIAAPAAITLPYGISTTSDSAHAQMGFHAFDLVHTALI